MKHLLISLILTLSCLVGCGPVGDVSWPEVAKCGPSVSDLVGVVSRILLDGEDYQRVLTDLARKEGMADVLCVVEQLRRDWSSAGSAMPPQHVEAAARAQAFLDSTGTQIVGAQ